MEAKHKHWPQVLALLIASLCAITNGLIFSWTSPFIPKLTEDKLNYDISEYEASNLAILQPVSTIITCGLTSHLSDLIGRKKTIMLIALPHVGYWIMTASASSIYVFYAAKLLAGVGDAGLYSALPMYIGEVSTPEVRGTWGNSMSSAMFLGEFLINVIGSQLGVRATAFVCLPLPLVFVAAFSFMPESPYYCVMKGRHQEAESALEFFGRAGEFPRLKADVERQMSERGSWLDVLGVESNRRAMGAAAFLRISQQIGGLSVFYMYTQLIFERSGSEVSPQLSSILFMGLCFVLNILVVAFLTSRISRRTSYIISLTPCAVVLYVLAVYFYVGEQLPSLKWLPIAGMILYQIFCSFGIAVIPTLMLGELFSASVKSKAMTLSMVVFSTTAFVTNLIFNVLLTEVGMYAPFLFFAICDSVAAVLSFFLIPETKGKSLEEIQQMLKKKRIEQ